MMYQFLSGPPSGSTSGAGAVLFGARSRVPRSPNRYARRICFVFVCRMNLFLYDSSSALFQNVGFFVLGTSAS